MQASDAANCGGLDIQFFFRKIKLDSIYIELGGTSFGPP